MQLHMFIKRCKSMHACKHDGHIGFMDLSTIFHFVVIVAFAGVRGFICVFGVSDGDQEAMKVDD